MLIAFILFWSDSGSSKNTQMRRIPCFSAFSKMTFVLSLFLSPSLHSFTLSFFHPSIYSFFIQPFIHPFIHSLIHPPTHSFIHSLIHSLIHPPTHSFIHLFTHSLNHPPMHKFIHSFSRCSSYVGKIGKRQDIDLDYGCWTRGIVAHEIGKCHHS